ncbi:MAG: hypothetical protein WAQ24_05140 [Candidatus Saccharimonadales bacterium]
METKQILAGVAALLALLAYIPYLRALIKKKIQPHPYTWLLWSIVTGITLAGQLVSGAGVGALPTAVSEVMTVCIFVFALQFGFKHIERVDNYYLAVALAGLIPWAITHSPTISVIIAVGIDLVAFAPTFRKTWRNPKSEAPILYGANTIKHMFGLLALQSYNIATVLHPLAMVVANAPMTLIILLRKPRVKI